MYIKKKIILLFFKNQLHGTLLIAMTGTLWPSQSFNFFFLKNCLDECIVTRGSSCWEQWTILQCYCFHMYRTLIGPSHSESILLPTYNCLSSASSMSLLGTFQKPLVRSFAKVPLHIFQVNVVSQTNHGNNVIHFCERWFVFAIFLLRFI